MRTAKRMADVSTRVIIGKDGGVTNVEYCENESYTCDRCKGENFRIVYIKPDKEGHVCHCAHCHFHGEADDAPCIFERKAVPLNGV